MDTFLYIYIVFFQQMHSLHGLSIIASEHGLLDCAFGLLVGFTLGFLVDISTNPGNSGTVVWNSFLRVFLSFFSKV